EDLLRGLPEEPSDETGHRVLPFLSHRSPSVRKAAAIVLSWAWDAQARRSLAQALEDEDSDVRIAALVGLRRVSGINGDVVAEIGRLLAGAFPATQELRA